MAPYEPRAPRQTLLSPVVADPLETFLASLDAAPDASGLPAYVERECYDAAVAPASGSVSQPWWVENGKERSPQQATCVRTVGFEGVTRGQRAAVMQ